MEMQDEGKRSSGSGWLEYAAPLFAILLVAAGAWWYYRFMKERSRDTVPQPPPPKLEFKLPDAKSGDTR
jgi:hypothetical protein